MKIIDLLGTLKEVSIKNSLGEPYIVGGLPRDIVLNRTSEFNDFDITTGRGDVSKLANIFSEEIGGRLQSFSNHTSVYVGENLVFDFSSNFTYDFIESKIPHKEFAVDNSIVYETYSRDFTLNSLLIPTDFSSIIDLTGQGLDDISKKIIDCPLDCVESFNESPNRMLRAYLYKATLGFSFSKSVQDALENNIHLFKEIKQRYASGMINKILRKDPSLLEELITIGALSYLPMTKYLTSLLLQKRRLLDVL